VDDIVTPSNLSSVDFAQGALLLIDKPEGWTSFDVVNKIRGTIRRVFNISKIKVGHAGTLDPMATGLLLICTGKWTTKLSEFQGLDKAYSGVMTLGATTDSYDKETPEENHKPYAHVTETSISEAAKTFTGEIDQVPPIYSAIKVDGKPLYKSARKGQEVEIASRRVVIHQFTIVSVQLPYVHFNVSCSKGTYIRSLAHDMGQMLGCGAYLSALRRTNIGEYRVEDAWQVDVLVDAIISRS
jgi:tRNA pseudouridine55 synthase